MIVADNFSQLHDLNLGDTVEILAPYGTLRLPIVGIIVDFVDQQGTVFVDRSVFLQYWRDDTVSDFRVFVAPGTTLIDVRQRIIDRFAGQRHVFVLTNEEATSKAVAAAFTRAAAQAGPNDLFLFFFSGHGNRHPRPNDASEPRATKAAHSMEPISCSHRCL